MCLEDMLVSVGTGSSFLNYTLDPRSSTWGMRTSRVRKDILGGTRQNITSIKMKHSNSLNLEPALILAFTKNRRRIEVLAYRKHAQSSN
jgi:hypothetical protein